MTNTDLLPAAVKQLLYVPTTGPGQRAPLCLICREDIGQDQPSATHVCCGSVLCKKCFLNYVLQKTWDTKTNVAMAADCPYCRRPILRPHPYAHHDVIMVATTLELVRQCVGDYVYFSKSLASRQQGDLLSDEQAMMMLDPEGRHPRAQQQYEEMKSHMVKGWRVFCFEEASPSTFLVAEGWKTIEECAADLMNIHPALRQDFVPSHSHREQGNTGNTTLVGEPEPAETSTRHATIGRKRDSKLSMLKKAWRVVAAEPRESMKADGLKLAYAGGS